MVQETNYPYVLATVATRKEGLTREEFRKHNEELYGPLLRKTAGKVHPLAWTRHYHVESSECPTGVPRMLIGTDNDLDWDCYGVMTFADELHLQQFIAFMHSDAAVPVLEEEEKFADPAKTKLVVMRRTVSAKED